MSNTANGQSSNGQAGMLNPVTRFARVQTYIAGLIADLATKDQLANYALQTALNAALARVATLEGKPRPPRILGTYATVSAFPSADGSTVFAGDYAYASSTGKLYVLSGTSTWTAVTDPLGLAVPTAPLALASDGRTLSMPAASAAQDGYMAQGMVAQLNAATAGVSTNGAAIAALQTKLGTDESQIAANSSAITALQGRATADEASIAALQARPQLSAITATGPIQYSGGYVISMPAATPSADGYMSKGLVAQIASNSSAISSIQASQTTDEGNITALLARPTLSSLVATGPLSYASSSYTLSIPAASASVDGYMTKAQAGQLVSNTSAITTIQAAQTTDEAAIAAIKAKTDVLAPSGAIRASANVSVAALAIGALGTYTVTVSGATVGMVASLAPPVGLVANLSSWSAAVTSANTVTIKFVASVAVLAGTQTFTILLQ
jgi:hypothetical protein